SYGYGAQDGLRMGYERTGPADLREEGRADLPGTRNRAASRLQRRYRDQDRSGSPQAGQQRLQHGQANSRREPRLAGEDGARVDRARSTRRERDQVAGRWQRASAFAAASVQARRWRTTRHQAGPAARTRQGWRK